MTDRRIEGLSAWKQRENNNRMIDLQNGRTIDGAGEHVALAYFGGSAFRITAPSGLSIMIDPWRNPPWGTWNWYLFDFPPVEVDIGIATHAHFDHDALHALHASVLLDRHIGRYEFADVAITGIADKHVSDASHCVYDWSGLTRALTPMETLPPDNWRSFDNSLILVEVAGLKILHWGDNRPNVPDDVWERIGEVDVALLPIDGSTHILSYEQIERVAERLKAKIVVPHHYFVWNITHRGSTLLPPDEWMGGRPNARWLDAGEIALDPDWVRSQSGLAMCFGGNVAFDLPTASPDPASETLC